MRGRGILMAVAVAAVSASVGPARALPSARAPGASAAVTEFDWGPFASRLHDLDGSVRLRAAGPIFERTVGSGTNLTAVRPAFAACAMPGVRRFHWDVVWPLWESRRLDGEYSARFTVAWYKRYQADNPRSPYRLWVLPFYFQGRADDGRGYAAVFPFGGRMDVLGRDVRFAMFPLWSKCRVNDAVTTDWMFPIYSETTGPNVHRWRIFPFYGNARQRGYFTKRFVMWPFWNQVRYTYPRSTGTGWILWPLCGHMNVTDQQSWMVLPPLIRWSRGQQLDYLQAPWPLVQAKSGRTSQLYIWPLFGRRQRAGVDSSFVAWPIFQRERIDEGSVVLRRYWVAPIVHYATRRDRYAPPGQDLREQALKIWPLAGMKRTGDAGRVRALELWPARDFAVIERNWAPLWTLFERRWDGDASETEFLWGFFRRSVRGDEAARTSLFPLVEWSGDRREGADRSSWSLLKGLVGSERDGAGRAWRLLWFVKFSTGGHADHHP